MRVSEVLVRLLYASISVLLLGLIGGVIVMHVLDRRRMREYAAWKMRNELERMDIEMEKEKIRHELRVLRHRHTQGWVHFESVSRRVVEEEEEAH